MSVEGTTLDPAVPVGRTGRVWLFLGVAVNAPGLAALACYGTSGLISKVLMEWLELPVVHLVVQLLFLFASALAPFTSLVAVPTIAALAFRRKLRGSGLVLCVRFTVLSWAGAILMQLWWDGKIPMPGVPPR